MLPSCTSPRLPDGNNSKGQDKAHHKGVCYGEHMVWGCTEGQGLFFCPLSWPWQSKPTSENCFPSRREPQEQFISLLTPPPFPAQSYSYSVDFVGALRNMLPSIQSFLHFKINPSFPLLGSHSKYILFTFFKKHIERLLASRHQETFTLIWE